jgi:hypothetical protein
MLIGEPRKGTGNLFGSSPVVYWNKVQCQAQTTRSCYRKIFRKQLGT